MDLLADALAVSGVRGTVGTTVLAGEDWGWWAEPTADAAFHAITSGTAWLRVAGRPAIPLHAGDVVLLPRGDAHVLAGDPAAAARTGPDRFEGYEVAGPGVTSIGSGPVRSRILCAHYSHDRAVSLRVLDLLPDVVHMTSADGAACLEDTVRLLGRELAHPQMASARVLDSLVDVLLVQLLRAWVAAHPEPEGPSWLGVLTDPLVGAAVAALHEDPARAWTTEALAREISVSRATLARRFPAVVGATPGAYLTRWRMDLAARRLRDTDDSLEAVAASVGYTSAPAFNRAFRRAWAQPPGRFRSARTAGAAGAAGAAAA